MTRIKGDHNLEIKRIAYLLGQQAQVFAERCRSEVESNDYPTRATGLLGRLMSEIADYNVLFQELLEIAQQEPRESRWDDKK